MIEKNEKNFFLGLFLLVAVLVFFIFKPFLTVIAFAVILAVLFSPVHAFITRRITRGVEWLSALLTVLAFLILLCVPLYFIGSVVLKQSQELYASVVENGGAGPLMDKMEESIKHIFPQLGDFDIQEKVTTFLLSFTSSLSTIFSETAQFGISFIVVLLSFFYFLKDGKHWRKSITDLSPLSSKYDDLILTKLTLSINGILKGYIFIACIQGFLVGLGMYLFGIPHAALLGVFAGVAALVPTIGVGLVSIPTILYLLYSGDTAAAIGFTAWVLLLVSTIDNVLSPIVVGKQISLPPLLILFSILGGIVLLGPIGVFLGPLAVSVLYTLIDIYKSDFKQA